MKKRFSVKTWDEVEDSDKLSTREIELDLPNTGTNDQIIGVMISQKLCINCDQNIKVTHVRHQSRYYVIQEDLGGGRLSVIIAYDCTE